MSEIHHDAAQNATLRQWRRFSAFPLGRRLFNRLVGFTVPYAASIRPQVLVIEPGLARVRILDRRRVRNHLRSIHAVALINLAEMTANLAMMSTQPRQRPLRLHRLHLRRQRHLPQFRPSRQPRPSYLWRPSYRQHRLWYLQCRPSFRQCPWLLWFPLRQHHRHRR